MIDSELLEYIKTEYNKGYSCSQISNKINKTKNFVVIQVRELGITRNRSESERAKKLWKESIVDKYSAEVKRLYIDNKMSMNEISDKLNISYWSVNTIINNAGIVRDYSESVKLNHDLHPEIKEQIRQTLTGTTRPQEVCDKIGAGHLGMIHTPTTRAKMSKSHTGVPLSSSHAHKCVLALMKGSKNHPNEEEKNSETS